MFIRNQIALVAMFLAGCSGVPKTAENDFVYKKLENRTDVGVSAFSQNVQKSFWIYGRCNEDVRNYVIVDQSRYPQPYNAPMKWKTFIAGKISTTHSYYFSDDQEFLSAVSSLEIAAKSKDLGRERSVSVANQDILNIPALCKAKQDGFRAEEKAINDRALAYNEKLIAHVVKRTGLTPMLPGDNRIDFNNLVLLLQKSGTSEHTGKFIWAHDGDYRVAQVMGRRALLVSMTNPAYFPTITIITDKEVLEGQFWSSVSRDPLQFIGISTYQTVLGARRQTILFKQI
ncbi:hypothetical protein [Pseudomonas fluorescens]|uniref:Lipoprotein n=1 Tax=Pseudomonas fluorescens TaxID=294 RepID=A0A5E7STB9_PSEFL|nr:hypothetical protein [Pseudomonas fluorescens]VVP89018.1 hypothetical protein PS928_01475 [Pseudomonas fluorescens]